MKYLFWNKRFEIGIPTIDKQHQELVELINQLHSSVHLKEAPVEVQRVSDQLISYMALHFRDEELEMVQCAAMPDTEKRLHKEQHAEFRRHIGALLEQHNLTHEQFAHEVLDYLSTWLISHILGYDMRLASYLSKDAASLEPIEQEEDLTVSRVERVLLAALNESERRFRLFSDHTPNLMWICDANGTRNFFNQTWHDITGEDIDALETSWQDWIHPADLPDYKIFLENCVADAISGSYEYRFKSVTGSYIYYYERLIPRFNAGNQFGGLVASAIDVTQLKEAEKLLSISRAKLEQEVEQRKVEIQKLMNFDPLTKVANYHHLMDQLDREVNRALRHGRPLSLLLLDIDDLKSYNQKLGRDKTDQLLSRFAGTLNKRFRESDIFGRLQGDEFLAVLPETGLNEARILANILISEVGNLNIGEGGKPFTMSISVGELNRHESRALFLNRCQRKLMEVQQRGGNNISQA